MEFGDYTIEVITNDEGEFIARVARKDGRRFKDRNLFLFDVLGYAETGPCSTAEEAIHEAKIIASASRPETQKQHY
jgi:hypothetical protein